MQIHFYTTYYNEKHDTRRSEMLECIRRNALNSAIDSIIIFNEGNSISEIAPDKITEVFITKRPTYNDFLSYINTHSEVEDFHIIANTDIFFDKHIGVLSQVLDTETCFALSRWDTTESAKPLLYNHNDSQDVWIFKGKIKDSLKADFPLGVPRCDNRFMYDIENAGYVVLNPSYSIKAYHLHKGQRAVVYTDEDNKYNIQRPYLYKYPHNLYGFWHTLWFNTTHKHKLARYRYDLKKINNWLPIRVFRKIFESVTGKKLPLIGYS